MLYACRRSCCAGFFCVYVALRGEVYNAFTRGVLRETVFWKTRPGYLSAYRLLRNKSVESHQEREKPALFCIVYNPWPVLSYRQAEGRVYRSV